MERREYVKAVASLPLISNIPSIEPEQEAENDGEWNVRGVWRRGEEIGYLHVLDDAYEKEFENYNEWVSTTLRRLSESSDRSHVIDLYDFRLISVYDGSYTRSHFTHDETNLEATIKREPDEEQEWSAFIRAVDETWEEARTYHSGSQIGVTRKLLNERDEYL